MKPSKKFTTILYFTACQSAPYVVYLALHWTQNKHKCKHLSSDKHVTGQLHLALIKCPSTSIINILQRQSEFFCRNWKYVKSSNSLMPGWRRDCSPGNDRKHKVPAAAWITFTSGLLLTLLNRNLQSVLPHLSFHISAVTHSIVSL